MLLRRRRSPSRTPHPIVPAHYTGSRILQAFEGVRDLPKKFCLGSSSVLRTNALDWGKQPLNATI